MNHYNPVSPQIQGDYAMRHGPTLECTRGHGNGTWPHSGGHPCRLVRIGDLNWEPDLDRLLVEKGYLVLEITNLSAEPIKAHGAPSHQSPVYDLTCLCHCDASVVALWVPARIMAWLASHQVETGMALVMEYRPARSEGVEDSVLIHLVSP